MSYTTLPIAGVDFTKTVAGTGTSFDQGAEFPLGTRVTAPDGQEWMYVHASGAITQYDCVGIDENYEAAAMTKTIADDAWFVGFAQVAFADNAFGWVALKGSNISCRLLASCAADVALYTTGTAGCLDDSSTGQTKIQGVVAVAAATTTISSREVLAANPFAF